MTTAYTLSDLQNWREVSRDVSPPIRLAVCGQPVAHSLSPQMQNAALQAAGLTMQYGCFEIAPNELAKRWSWRAASVSLVSI